MDLDLNLLLCHLIGRGFVGGCKDLPKRDKYSFIASGVLSSRNSEIESNVGDACVPAICEDHGPDSNVRKGRRDKKMPTVPSGRLEASLDAQTILPRKEQHNTTFRQV